MSAVKRSIKLLISTLVFIRDWIAKRVFRLLGLSRPGTAVVLYYHAMPDHLRERFARQLDDLLRFAKPIEALPQLPLAPNVHHVAITFDDGFQSVVDNALPELQSRSIPVTLFVPVGQLGRIPAWEMESGVSDRGEVVMDEAQLRALDLELVTVGSHSWSHPVFPRLDAAAVMKELMDSRRILERMLGRQVKLFSFPYGAYDAQCVELSRKADYEHIFGIEPLLAFNSPNDFVTGRVLADPSDWYWEFRLKLLGAYRWLPYTSRWKARLRDLFAC